MSIIADSPDTLTGLNKLSQKHLDELISSGLPPEIAHVIGESVTADEAKDIVGYALPGLLFRFFDPIDGERMTAKGESKWSRNFARLKPDWETVPVGVAAKFGGDDKPKYLSPKKAGNRPYFPPIIDWKKIFKSSQPLDITEGEKKAVCLTYSGYPTIGLSGVFAWKDATERESDIGSGSAFDVDEPEDEDLDGSRLLPELAAIDWAYRDVAIVFDSDASTKGQVKQAIAQLATNLSAPDIRARPFPVLLPNELDGSKNGADDFVVRHGRDAYELLRSSFQRLQSSRNRLLKTAKKPITLLRGKDLIEHRPFYWSQEEPPSPIKAAMAASVLKDCTAYRSSLGWYGWNGQIWVSIQKEEVEALLLKFCKAQGWIDNPIATLNLMMHTLKATVATKSSDAVEWGATRYRVFSNGTFDFQENQFLGGVFDRRHRQTIAMSYPWQPFNEQAFYGTHFYNFLHEATNAELSTINLIRAMIAWCLMPKANAPFVCEKIFDLYGSPGTGKGTLLEALRLIVGEENTATIDQTTIASAEERAQLVDKLIAVDTDAHGHWGNTGTLLKIASNEPVTVRRLYYQGGAARLGCVLVRAYNSYPSTGSGASGLDRRIITISFDKRPKTVDPGLKGKIAQEIGLVAAWARELTIDQIMSELKNAGNATGSAQATFDRACSNDSVLAWVAEALPHGTKHQWEIASELYRRYAEYTKAEGGSPIKSRSFYLHLKSWERVGVERQRERSGSVYKIPSLAKMIGDGLLPVDASKLDIDHTPITEPITPPITQSITADHTPITAQNTIAADQPVADLSATGDGLCGRSNPYGAKGVQHVADKSQNFFSNASTHQENAEQNTFPDLSATSYTAHTGQGFHLPHYLPPVADRSATNENLPLVNENSAKKQPEKTLKIGSKITWNSRPAIIALRDPNFDTWALLDGGRLTPWIKTTDLDPGSPPTLETIAQLIDELHHLAITWHNLNRSFSPDVIDQAIATLPRSRHHAINQSRRLLSPKH
jgi:putative DNA primase/helicase